MSQPACRSSSTSPATGSVTLRGRSRVINAHLRTRSRRAHRRALVGAARWLFERRCADRRTLQAAATDTGAIQRGSARHRRARNDSSGRGVPCRSGRRSPHRRGSRALKAAGARLVVGDIPPLAFAAAARAGVPIDRDLQLHLGLDLRRLRRRARARAVADRSPPLVVRASGRGVAVADAGRIRGDEQDAGAAVHRASRADIPARTVRARLGLPADEPLMLISFGGYVAKDLDAERAAATLTAARIVVTSASKDGHPAGTHRHPRRRALRLRPALRRPRRARSTSC